MKAIRLILTILLSLAIHVQMNMWPGVNFIPFPGLSSARII